PGGGSRPRAGRGARVRHRPPGRDERRCPRPARRAGDRLLPAARPVTMAPAPEQIVVSGARPTGRQHLGTYHGALKNWLRLQSERRCFFFVADWHALTTDWASPAAIEENVIEMVLDWLAVGLDPERATLFRQSAV